jgi:hypothetical protein
VIRDSSLPIVAGNDEVSSSFQGVGSDAAYSEVRGARAYSSWFSHGIVALDVSDPKRPQKVGQFVPDTSKRYSAGLGVGPTEFWGVAVDPETGHIYGSDMRSGLWILKPTERAAS